MLKEIENYNEFKKNFVYKFKLSLIENPEFRKFFDKFMSKETTYVIGGYLRDIVLKKRSRDIDIIYKRPFNEIVKQLNSAKLAFEINRLDGIKIHFENIDLDIWSIYDNWAFKNNLISINEENELDSIANGCFYNYDSLVINLKTLNMNVKGYNHFVRSNSLDILQKNKRYQNLNPTIEANILRAFYLKKIFNISFLENCNKYIISKLGQLNDNYYSSTKRLLEVKKNYQKYDVVLNEFDIIEYSYLCQETDKELRLII